MKKITLVSIILVATTAIIAQTHYEIILPPVEHLIQDFGQSVEVIADISGDGIPDFIVGAPRDGIFSGGLVHVYNGADQLLLYTIAPPFVVSEEFGYVVLAIADQNTDGFEDILVSATKENDVSVGEAGRVHLFSGLDGTYLRTFSSPNPETQGLFGISIASLEQDFDGDGIEDILIGAQRESSNSFDGGNAYLLSGATGNELLSYISPDPTLLGEFGSAISSLQDINGDGVREVLIGASNERNAGIKTGIVHLYNGADGVYIRSLTSALPRNSGEFGVSITESSDLDGDGYNDILIGAPSEFDSGEPIYHGNAYIFSGLTGSVLSTITPLIPGKFGTFGTNVKNLGADIDLDGIEDIMISDNGSIYSVGRIYIHSGADGSFIQEIQEPNRTKDSFFGSSVVSFESDIDGDGAVDILVGANTLPTSPFARGVVYQLSAIANCANSPAPISLSSSNVIDGVLLTWDPVPGSIGCLLTGGETGSISSSYIIDKFEANERFIPNLLLTPATSYTWNIEGICASNFDVITGTSADQVFSTLSPKLLNTSPITLFPNPAKDLFYISNIEAETPILIYNIKGEFILSILASSGQELINTENWLDGIYHINIEGQETVPMLISH